MGSGLGYKRDALLVFLLLAFVFGYFYQDSGGNGNSRFGLIFAVVEQGRLKIDSYHNRAGTSTDDKAYYQGHYYSDKNIGTSVIGSIFYAGLTGIEKLLHFSLGLVGVKYFLTLLTIGLPSAFVGSLMYVLLIFLSGSRLRAFAVTLAIMLGTLALPFSLVFFGHQLAAALLWIAFFLIFQLRVRPDLYHTSYLFAIGLVLGLALVTEYTTALIVAPLVLYYFYVALSRKANHRITAITLPALGGLIPAGILLVYNKVCFGSPFSIGYQHLADPVFKAGMSQGIAGVSWPQLKVLYYLTLHPAIGLFWESPVLLLALAGFVFLFRYRRFRLEGGVAAFAFAALLLLNAGYYMWWGGYSPGPRHLVPALPFLALPLIFVPRRFFPLVILLAIVSAVQMFIVAASAVLVPDDMMRRIDQLRFFQYSAIFSYDLPKLLRGEFTPNLGQFLFGLHGWSSLVPILLTLIGGAVYFIVSDRQAASQPVLVLRSRTPIKVALRSKFFPSPIRSKRPRS